METSGLCWVEITTASMRFGTLPTYSTLTWLLPSGRRKSSMPSRRAVGKALHQLVRHHDRQRHQLGRFVAGEAEHQPLVARAARIHAHRDVGRLRLDQVVHAAGVAIEPVGGVVVADVLDGAARDPRHVHVGLGGDLAGHDAGAGGDQDFARHAPRWVVRQHGVQNARRKSGRRSYPGGLPSRIPT